MRLLWKLLRRHVSVLQLAGFFVTSLVGVGIVLAALQLRADVMPVLSAPDSFLRSDYVVLSPTPAAAGERAAFTAAELDLLRAQPFVRSLGEFVSARYRVQGGLQMGSMGMQTYLFFESVPDAFLDVRDAAWGFSPGDKEVPIILPRNYLNLYNFGFAATRGLPQITEQAVRALPLDLTLGSDMHLKGRVVAFSSRLNTILVPDAFMRWSNERLAQTPALPPSRVIIEASGSADMYTYFKQHGYRTEGGDQTGQLSYALRMATLAVAAVGGLITLLAVLVLMLSIYLLLEKNTQRLQDLLLVGYSPAAVARPYQLLALSLNALVWAAAVGVLVVARGYWLPHIALLAEGYAPAALWPAALCGAGLMGLVSVIAAIAIFLKIRGLRYQ